MKRSFQLGFAAASVLTLTGASHIEEHDHTLCNFLPDNNLHVYEMAGESNVTEKEFRDIIAKAESIYTSVIKESHKGTLKIKPLWDNNVVNASASRRGSTWLVNMYGGLARRPEVTADGFTLVLCHELGHHLGGYPFVSSWAANEGQSDYFATHACAHLMWQDEVEKNASFAAEVPEYPKQLCDEHWTTEEKRNLCYRSMLAGKSLGSLLAALRGSATVEFETPDTNEVSRTYNSHPEAQCRLDTYMKGALCTAKHVTEIIPGTVGVSRNSLAAEQQSANYTCSRNGVGAEQARPRCWFRPLAEQQTGIFEDTSLAFTKDSHAVHF